MTIQSRSQFASTATNQLAYLGWVHLQDWVLDWQNPLP